MHMTLGRKSFLSCESLSHLITTDVTKRSLFSEELKKQLESKRMIYTKDQLHLSTTVGQGKCLEDTLCLKMRKILYVHRMSFLLIGKGSNPS